MIDYDSMIRHMREEFLVESIDHGGALRFSDTLPYNENMLSIITNTNTDIVRAALQVFQQLNMVEILDDNTIFMTEVNNLIGSETAAAERQRRSRAARLESKNAVCDNVTTLSQDCHIDKDKEKNKDKDIEKDKEKTARFIPPSLDEIRDYCIERNNGIDPEKFFDHYTANGWTVGKNKKMVNWRAAVRLWEKREKDFGSSKQQPKQNTNVFLDMITGGEA